MSMHNQAAFDDDRTSILKSEATLKDQRIRDYFVELSSAPPTYFDIETAPTDDPDVIAEIEASIAMPVIDLESITASANLKDPEKIAADIEKRRAKAVLEHECALADRKEKIAEKIAKTALDGSLCRVVSYGLAFGDEGVIVETIDVAAEDKWTAEGVLLQAFFDNIDMDPFADLVGHCILGFDVPVLTKRAIAHGIRLPSLWPWPYNHGGSDNRIVDTMVLYTGSKTDYIKLDVLARRLGVKGKLAGVQGQFVHQMLYSGDPEQIRLAIEYQRDDVESVRAVHKKIARSLNHFAVNEARSQRRHRDHANRMHEYLQEKLDEARNAE